jgi:hypothetical protein
VRLRGTNVRAGTICANNDDMAAALEALSKCLNGSLKVNVEWDEKKQRFKKKKASYAS